MRETGDNEEDVEIFSLSCYNSNRIHRANAYKERKKNRQRNREKYRLQIRTSGTNMSPAVQSPSLGLIRSIWQNVVVTTRGLRIQRCTTLAVITITHTHTHTSETTEYLWRKVQQQFLHLFAFYYLWSDDVVKCCCWMTTLHDCCIINTDLHTRMQRRHRWLHVYVHRMHLVPIKTRLTFISKYRLLFIKVLQWLRMGSSGLCQRWLIFLGRFLLSFLTNQGHWVMVYAVLPASLPLCHSRRRGRQRVKDERER